MYRGWPPSQGWRTFLTNHVDGIAAIDLFVLPTITFRLLYCLVIMRHGRRLWVSFGITTNPTAEWISRQATEAFPWDSAPRYLIQDWDTAYGPIFRQSPQFSHSLCAPGLSLSLCASSGFGSRTSWEPKALISQELRRPELLVPPRAERRRGSTVQEQRVRSVRPFFDGR
jgi:hypothetical protein